MKKETSCLVALFGMPLKPYYAYEPFKLKFMNLWNVKKGNPQICKCLLLCRLLLIQLLYSSLSISADLYTNRRADICLDISCVISIYTTTLKNRNSRPYALILNNLCSVVEHVGMVVTCSSPRSFP